MSTEVLHPRPAFPPWALLSMAIAAAWLFVNRDAAAQVQSPPSAMPPSTAAYGPHPERLAQQLGYQPGALDPSRPEFTVPPPSTPAYGPMLDDLPPGAYPSSPINGIPSDTWIGSDDLWSWQPLPSGLIYRSYLAGMREPRLGAQWVSERKQGWLWDVTLGGRAGLLRYGTENDAWPEGWQLDLEGAAFPRLNWITRDVYNIDFRAGVPLTYRRGPWETKIGYYHYCSHLVDEWILITPGWARKNYVRDSIVGAIALRPIPALRIYAETSWAFDFDDGAQPWNFQFGIEYSPVEPSGLWGAPFVAVNALLHEEVKFGGSFIAQLGWQWRGKNGHLLRFGGMYFNGMSDQAQNFDQFEEQAGFGVWYDF